MPGQISYIDGAKFPAVQVSSTDVNTLDDYEEGTFEAAFATGGGSATIAAAASLMSYTKIGRVVTICGYIEVGSISSPVGLFSVTGLPFACANLGDSAGGCAVTVTATGLEATAATTIVASIAEGDSQINMFRYATGNLANMAADVKAGSGFYLSATYFTG